VSLGPGTFVSGTSIAYPILAARKMPRQGAVYRVRAWLRYAGGVARLDTLVHFGRAAAVRQQLYGGPPASPGSSGLPTWAVVLLSTLAGALLAGAVLFVLARRRRAGMRRPERALDAALQASRESGEPLTVLALSALNGAAPMGDVTTALRPRLRQADRLCRVDDRRLLIVAPATDVETAGALADDLRRQLARAGISDSAVTIAVHAADDALDATNMLTQIWNPPVAPMPGPDFAPEPTD
jgi:GGDEF domain-containing protein